MRLTSITPYVFSLFASQFSPGQQRHKADYPLLPLRHQQTLMTYDFYGNSWSTTSGPNSPLNVCQEGASSVSTSIAAWIAAGFPACKILMGVPGYSHTFTTKTGTLVKTKYKGVYTQSFQPLASTQTADPSLVRRVTLNLFRRPQDSSLFVATQTFNQLIKAGYLNSAGTAGAGGYKRYWDACTMTPFLFYPYKKQWITYDDASSIGHKALLARKLGLAGVVSFEFWRLLAKRAWC